MTCKLGTENTNVCFFSNFVMRCLQYIFIFAIFIRCIDADREIISLYIYSEETTTKPFHSHLLYLIQEMIILFPLSVEA